MNNIKDTRRLQTRSLMEFMKRLDYWANSAVNRGFVYEGKCPHLRKNLRHISFEDAIRLHNGIIMRMSKRFVDAIGAPHLQPLFDENHLGYHLAQEHRYVKRVKLQRDKSEISGFKVQDHRVELLPEAFTLF